MTELLSGTAGMDRIRGEELSPCSPQDRSVPEDPDQGEAHRPSLETAEQRQERRRRLDMVLRALI